MIASLTPQFSDVELDDINRSFVVPPAPYPFVVVRETRVGQTIWCCVDALSLLPDDAYLMIRPFFRIPGMEFIAGALPAESIKRIDVPGAPSPLGTCISEMLGDAWRFLVPAGGQRSYAFFVPSDGLGLVFAAWATDLAGVPIAPSSDDFSATLWSSVGSTHALMNSSEEQP